MELRIFLVMAGFASLGALYFTIYRVILFKKLKWKMIHSIWIPLLVSLFSVFIFFSYKDLDGFGSIAAVISLMILNFPVGLYLILFGYFSLKDSKASKS
jgi:hypothetical protein